MHPRRGRGGGASLHARTRTRQSAFGRERRENREGKREGPPKTLRARDCLWQGGCGYRKGKEASAARQDCWLAVLACGQ
eukprot:6189599-Pleurochrysis_carterae.AAC.4